VRADAAVNSSTEGKMRAIDRQINLARVRHCERITISCGDNEIYSGTLGDLYTTKASGTDIYSGKDLWPIFG
jgi:hypothetical protein